MSNFFLAKHLFLRNIFTVFFKIWSKTVKLQKDCKIYKQNGEKHAILQEQDCSFTKPFWCPSCGKVSFSISFIVMYAKKIHFYT